MRLFIILSFILTTFTSFSQLGVNLDFQQSKKIDSRAIGLSLQYLLGRSAYRMPALKSGVFYRQDSGQDQIMIPLELQYRHFLIGGHRCSGGIYAEASGGTNFVRSMEKDVRTEQDEQLRVFPTFSGAIGVHSPMGWELNFRVGAEYVEKKLAPFYGIKLGYFIF